METKIGEKLPSIDVVLLTKNSMPCLMECVDSIYRNINVNRLIVVDGGSTDGTVEFLRQYPNVELIFDINGTRATARQKGIEAAETEWHAHIDSDVILCNGWQGKIWKHLAPDVGAVWGVCIPIEKHAYSIAYAMSKFYRRSIADMLTQQIRTPRCGTHDTLFRTELLKDIKIPRDLHIWEDQYIGMHIIRKGYRFLKVKNPYCLHNVYEKGIDSYTLNGYLMHKYGYGTYKKTLTHFLLAVPKSMWILALSRDFEAAKRQLLSYILTFKGWLAY